MKKNKVVMQLSRIINKIPQALSIYINQIVYDLKRRGYDVTTLSLGEAFFDIPLFDFSKLDLDKCYHYSESQGLLELREKIGAFYGKQYGVKVDHHKEILISAGSKPLIFMAMQAILNPGDEALIHEPSWLSYQEQLKMLSAVPKFIPYNCNISNFVEYFTEKTKLLILNNPNNPAGWLYRKEDLEMIYEECRKRGIYVLVDEAYSDFVVNKADFCSMARIAEDKDGIIVVNSLSKNMGMSGLRVGYVISSSNVIEHILKINQHLITCASTIVLHYLARYFDDIIKITLPQVKSVVEKRLRVENMLKKNELKFLPGSTTFYFFVNIEDFPAPSLDFSLYLLLKHKIAVVPGSAYGESTERFIRLSIGTESEERIHDAIMIMRNLIVCKSFNHEELDALISQNNIKRFENGSI